VEIENLASDLFRLNNITSLTASDIQTKTGVNTQFFNLERIDLVSFENGKAKYKFTLKTKKEFRLVAQRTFDNTTQVLTLEVKN